METGAITKALHLSMLSDLAGVSIEAAERDVDGSTWHDVAGVTGKVRLDWKGEPPADPSSVNTRLAATIAKAKKQSEVDTWFTTVIAAGYDTGLGYSIRIDTEARNEFDALMTSINAELLSGTLIASVSPQYIFGIDTSSPDGLDPGHVISALQFIQLYAAGGTYYKQLLGLRKQYTAAIQSGFTDFTVGEPLPGE